VTTDNLTSRVFEKAWNKRNPQWAEAAAGQVRPHVDLPARRLPRYVLDRVAIKARALRNPRHPWVTEDALALLDQLLAPTNRGLEFGSGGTTPWFAGRVEFLDSVEGGEPWHAATKKHLAELGITNVGLHLASGEELGYGTPAHRDAYVNANPDLQPESLDFVFVDGEYRDDCAVRGLRLLKPGGLLILDNAESYLPVDTRSPWHVERPVTPLWEQVAEEIADWRRLSTSNGVWDTVLWIKP
jgi:predicted O-methyltransferase YrrM